MASLLLRSSSAQPPENEHLDPLKSCFSCQHDFLALTKVAGRCRPRTQNSTAAAPWRTRGPLMELLMISSCSWGWGPGGPSGQLLCILEDGLRPPAGVLQLASAAISDPHRASQQLTSCSRTSAGGCGFTSA